MDFSVKNPRKFISLWLFACAFLVLVMAVIGAITRLTESGLSIVEWRPYIGILPPLSSSEWQRVFALYQQTPEFRLKNFGMDISQFKHIYFWEWLHRAMGQLISFFFAVPLAWFWIRKKIPSSLKLSLLGILLLGTSQGLMGWYMVKSGLIDRPDVSHYRLAAHLLLALFLYITLMWVGLRTSPLSLALSRKGRGDSGSTFPIQSQKWGWIKQLSPLPLRDRVRERGIKIHILFSLLLLILTITWGAFTAGLDAGFVYNTFPLMNGRWIPPEAFHLQPLWHNAFENIPMVQFIHRWLAIITATSILFLATRLWSTSRKLSLALILMVLIQISLGISTLLFVVPIPLAAAHQAGAFVLTGLLIIIFYRFTQKQQGS